MTQTTARGCKIETRQLKIFITVYKSGSFTKASEILSTSQPTISEQIKALETKIGCKLFDRLGRSIRPTNKADIFFPKALKITEEINQLEEEMCREDQDVSGELILGASTIPGAYILPHFATIFKKEHPEISFEIKIADSAEIIDSVLNHDLLIGIVGSKISSQNLIFSPFIEDELILAAATKRETSNTIPITTLQELPFLLREKGSGTRTSMEHFIGEKNLDTSKLNKVAVLGSNAAIKEAIKADLGVSILSRVSINDELKRGQIREIKVAGLPMKRKFYAVTLKNRSIPNHYNVFLEKLLTLNNGLSSKE